MPLPIEVTGPSQSGFESILTPEALEFVADLNREFNPRRKELLARRHQLHDEIQSGKRPAFLEETRAIREGDWQIAPLPDDLQDRRSEITGPVDRKMMINALNSGAYVFMADLEDSNSPHWHNQIQGQINLRDAYDRTISFTNPAGKHYALKDGRLAVMLVRPRGLHMEEKHLLVEGKSTSGSLLDVGLYLFHNAQRSLNAGTGPYFYLPKMEGHLEARWFNDVFTWSEQRLDIPHGSIKVTVLIETILAAFEMEEILHELRDHITGLNAGRWDYMFSAIKKFHHDPDFLWPDRSQVTMTVPMMRAYTELMVRTCHKRGAHAIGGMAAFIPSRKDAEINRTALAKVHEDKEREANDGFDGSWVAHPDLVPTCTEVFSTQFEDGRVNQKHRMREDVNVAPEQLLDFTVPGGKITEAGVRLNIRIGIQYIQAWLRGNGAVALYNLMEDAATAEISRSQIWQWIQHPEGKLDDGRKVTVAMIQSMIPEELVVIRTEHGASYHEESTLQATQLFETLVVSDTFEEFLTTQAYDLIE